MGLAYRLARPLLFRMDPERAHAVALRAAAIGGAPLAWIRGGDRIEARPRTVAGLRFPNPLGLAAGLDKNGVALPFWRALGFGFFEFGTVTPRPQPGNPPPRLWRFPAQRSLVNALGFPNDGAAAVAARLARARRTGDVVGINLGRNKETPNERAAGDYVAALDMTAEVADYFAVNVSSPNTPGLRALQTRGPLTELLGRVREAAGRKPLFVKLSPDANEAELADAAAAVRDSGCAGVIATNTTLARVPGVEGAGGMSGAPLRDRARAALATLRALLDPGFPIISVGGIDGPEEARHRLDAGADLLQIYTALVFEGPDLVPRILGAL
jgi:dihydroorotate dehydrogenase